MAENGHDLPLARAEGLLTEEVEAEIVVYDSESKQAHCLSPLAALVLAPLALLVPGSPKGPLLWVIAAPFVALWLYRRGRHVPAWPRSSAWHSRLQASAVAASILLIAPIHFALFGR